MLANDTDPDCGPKSIDTVTQPANGTVVKAGDSQSLTYKPNANYCNDPGAEPTDDFTYKLTPGGDEATVAMTVTCADDSPVAVDDTATVAEDSDATTLSVLANDTDPDSGPKSIDTVTQPTNGTVVKAGDWPEPDLQAQRQLLQRPRRCAHRRLHLQATPGGDEATVAMTVTCADDSPDRRRRHHDGGRGRRRHHARRAGQRHRPRLRAQVDRHRHPAGQRHGGQGRRRPRA